MALLSLPFTSSLLPGGWGCGALAASASPLPRPLRSLGWSVPSELTVLNDLEAALKVYWCGGHRARGGEAGTAG